ncbi:MAG TPA: AI-2E family transporter, partial [Segetibacter sp.]
MGLILLTHALINLRDILVPIAFAVIFAILLNPLVNRFRRLKLSNALSIAIVMLVAIIVVAALLYFLSSQIAGFGENLPLLKTKLADLLHQLQGWLQARFGLALNKQVELVNEALNNSKALVGKTVGTALGTLSVVFLLPVYIFLLLFYKSLILNFLYEVFAEENSGQVAAILNQTKTAIQSYMVGLLLEALIVAVLNSVALLILGVPYAILLGVI